MAGELASRARWPGSEVARIYELDREPEPQNLVDPPVFARWQQLGIQPARPCSDAVFVRRAFLDLTGTLPDPAEVLQFFRDPSPAKRERLVADLLEREEFALYWGMKWSDLLRIKAEFPINLWPQAARVYHDWVVQCLREHKPYDQFARELLTASGSSFRDPPVNFYRAVQNKDPLTLAKAVALTWMGVRADKWPPERLQGFAAFFSRVGYKSTGEWKEEVVYFDFARKGAPQEGVLPDGTRVVFTPDKDPREIFADWLIQPRNPWFARNIVNRLWAWMLGRGVIHEPDDIREDNLPSVPGLLDALERELVNSRWDLRHIYRLVATSAVYQLSPIPRSDHPESSASFAYYPVRRLEAEVLADALRQVTGIPDQYISAIPEPFTVTPPGMRSIALPDGSISNAFLELFGRPPRDTGMESERNNRISSGQRLYLLNSSQIHSRLGNSPKLRAVMRKPVRLAGAIEELYLMILSRRPTPEELDIVTAYLRSWPDPRSGLVDVAWALINTAEFLYRH